MEVDIKLKGGFVFFCVKNVKCIDVNNELLRFWEGLLMICVDMSVIDVEGFIDIIYEYMIFKIMWKNK